MEHKQEVRSLNLNSNLQARSARSSRSESNSSGGLSENEWPATAWQQHLFPFHASAIFLPLVVCDRVFLALGIFNQLLFTASLLFLSMCCKADKNWQIWQCQSRWEYMGVLKTMYQTSSPSAQSTDCLWDCLIPLASIVFSYLSLRSEMRPLSIIFLSCSSLTRLQLFPYPSFSPSMSAERVPCEQVFLNKTIEQKIY